jgi:uncharacterized protein (TIGR03083 family)
MPARPELLEDIDPFDLLDVEAARLDAFWVACSASGWTRPTRCSEWTVRDMLGHLAFVEDYNQAGLAGTVKDFIARSGADDLDQLNAWGVQLRADRPAVDVVAEWRDLNATYRREMRARGRNGSIDTSVGDYPSWQQAFYLATEYATHADDMAAPVAAHEAAGRIAWRVRFIRYGVEEYERPVVIRHHDGINDIEFEGAVFELTDAELVAAGVGRLPAAHAIPSQLRAALACLA